MKKIVETRIAGKRVLILGLGVEGKSTYRLLRKLFPHQLFTLADQRIDVAYQEDFQHPFNIMHVGADYLNHLDAFDIIIKSPGISKSMLPPCLAEEKLTSQTGLFLESFRDQIIGITGTKGKSTTASLIQHLLSAARHHSILIGNIGLPPFDILDQIKHDTLIVFELSSHQLEDVHFSPHIAVLLNIYQEHLDHYTDFRAYQLAKYNIMKWQLPDDFSVYSGNDGLITSLIKEFTPVSHLIPFGFDDRSGFQTYLKDKQVILKKPGEDAKICDLHGLKFLPGKHNQLNLMAALTACLAAGAKISDFCSALNTFQGLQHRLEFVGCFEGKRFYNDSIATIPEAVIYAVETIKDVDTLILGGYDRGVDYSQLIEYLGNSAITNFFFTGNAGKRLMNELKSSFTGKHNYNWYKDFDEMVNDAIMITPEKHSCLLSPAAASYDQFMNFEHRGNRFKELIRKWFKEPAK